MRTPTDNRTGFRVAAWSGALLMTAPVVLVVHLIASATVVEATSESVPARYQLDDAAPGLVVAALLIIVALGGLLTRWGAGAVELTAVVPVLLVLPYLALAWHVAQLWTGTGLPLTANGEPSWAVVVGRSAGVLGLLGLGALAVGTIAGRLGAGPVALTLLVVTPVAALALSPTRRYASTGPFDWDYPLWFSLGVLSRAEADDYETTADDVCGVLSTGICERTVGPLGAGVHLLVLLALLAAVAVAASVATRALRRPRRRLTT